MSAPRIITHRPDLAQPRREPAGPPPKLVARAVPLGDAVELIAKPVARQIDRVTAAAAAAGLPIAPTRLAGCSACSKRRRVLNELAPDIRPSALFARARAALDDPLQAPKK